MDTEERIKVLEDEFQATKEELKKILYDMRTYLMEALTPIPNDLERDRLSTFLDEWNAEKREALDAQKDSQKQDAALEQTDSEKGVEPDGNRQES